ncbi:interferon-induced very large GTPase 1-like [Ruditapes philippinarum]|uniref:interferon-induced very large GTPase 1-like n=1 Tax=Ruditapes philippinarum TaxID=129788 RepID=UPI00295BDE27|nr:interferon-induced very large GTPase 1-like [Ruditapes philippinarum]
MTNEKLDIRKCCAFIHQNVPDTSASEKMIGGLSKLLQTLDKMTKESARSEGILDITTFNQVIEFDINSQVWYLKNLWQGNPPMARVNNEYSDSVVDIKYNILKKALYMKDKSYKTLTDMIEQAHDLWKGVLNEDFVFSFRNSLEIKAYMQMECVVQAELWRLESIIRDKLIQESQINFATCDQKDDLRNVSHKLTSWLHDLLSRNHEEELRERSLAVANDHKGHNLSNEKINQLFDDIWKEFLHQLDTSSTSMEKHRRSMRNIFTTCLENLLKNNNALLKQALKESNYLTPLSNVKKLASSFSETGINETDISFAMIQRREALFGFSYTLKYVGTRVKQIFKSVDVKIKELCQINDEVTEMSCSVRAILSGDCQYTFKVPFYVKVYVHVSRHAHPIFESHNEKYFESYGTAALLAKYRAQLKISFESHLRCRLFEDLVAELFSNIIESFAEEWTLQSLPNNVTDSLHSLLPKVKNRVIIEICTDLLEEGDFDNFVNYIVDPHAYATLWITKKANQYLDESEFNVLESTSSSLLQKLYISVRKCVNDVKKKFERTSPPSMQTWIESFQNSMTSSDFRIPSESFRNIKKEASSGIHGKQNVEHFTTKILQHLEGSEKKLKSKFKSQKSHTITWVGFNPISRIIKKIWGCTEKCVFCGEPCAKDQAHDGSTHYCIQHRPSCCRGVRDRYSKIACLESCEFDVQSNTTHTCSVFNYICNNEKRKECGKTHFYRDFKTYLPNWDIAPTSNMHDSSKYWMWFVVTYKEDLKKLYNYKIKGIPSTWNSITKLEAKESLHKIYSA